MNHILINTFNRNFIVGVLLLIVSSVSIAGHHAENEEPVQQAEDSSFNLAELNCWDVMTLDDSNRNTVLFLYYGYVSGQKGELIHNSTSMQTILSELGKHCRDNPDDLILELMTKD